MSAKPLRVVKFRIPKYCVCPTCNTRQRFRCKMVRHKTVKDINTDKEALLKVRIVYARCTNPECPTKSFALPTRGVGRYQRATDRLMNEATAGIVDDLSTTRRVAKRLHRAFNTTGSRSTVDRWKHKLADGCDFRDIIPPLGFSGILCIDEYKPKCSDKMDLFATDRKTNRILYIEPVAMSSPKGALSRGSVEKCLWHLKEFGIEPKGIIFDLLAAYPGQVRKVWPDVIVQYDYYHVKQLISNRLKDALKSFRRSLEGDALKPYRDQLWDNRWNIIMDMDKWDAKAHKTMQELMDIYEHTPVEHMLLFRERVNAIFQYSATAKEAYQARAELLSGTWWRSSYHLSRAVKFLAQPNFQYMITYLVHPFIPRAGNSETLIRTWRQMEKVRYGFKSQKGKLDHLKIFQINSYLNGQLL